MFYASVGDLDAAEAAIARSERDRRKFEAVVVLARAHDVVLDEETLVGVGLTRALILGGRGTLSRLRGDLADAEAKLREALTVLRQSETAIKGFTSAFAGQVAQRLTVRLADTLRDGGRLAEAESLAREALAGAIGTAGRVGLHTADVLISLNDVFLVQGRFADAETLARLNIANLERSGASPASVTFVRARQQLATAFAGRGDWGDAVQVYDALALDLNEAPAALKTLLRSDPARALAYLRAGAAAKALAAAEDERAWAQSVFGDDHYVVAEAGAVRAAALASLDRAPEAVAEIEAVVASLLDPRARSVAGRDPIQTRRLEAILDAYVSATDGAGTVTAREIAFRIAESVRNSSVVADLATSAARASISIPELADLVRRDQDAEEQIAALFNLLGQALSQPPGVRDEAVVARLRAQIELLKSARRALASEIAAQYPEHGGEAFAPAPTIAEVQRALAADEALIAVHAGPERTFVWAVPKSGAPVFADVPYGADDLAERVALIRAALAPEVSTLGDIPDFDFAEALALYRALLEPVEAGWRAAKTLVVVADGALASLPMGLLPTREMRIDRTESLLFAEYRGAPWLIRDHATVVVPSVTSLLSLRSARPRAGERAFAGFGNPEFATAQQAQPVAAAEPATTTRGVPVVLRSLPRTLAMRSARLESLPPLPDTETEIVTVGRILGADPASDIHLGAAANEDRVKALSRSGELAKYRVISFATHGLVAGELDGLTQPALAMSNPAATGGAGDGLLTMEEIFGLRLNAEWTILSACNTAAGAGNGAETISGLGRAFFYAGARSLLVSNWPVHSAATTELMVGIFGATVADPGLGRAEAHRRAVIALIDDGVFTDSSGRPVFAYAHPIFWAPFSLVGDGGASAPPQG